MVGDLHDDAWLDLLYVFRETDVQRGGVTRAPTCALVVGVEESDRRQVAHRRRAGFGGGCHWCTEAVFQVVPGVLDVRQGWCSGLDAPDRFSEGVVVAYDARAVSLPQLVAVHLHTHSCTADHPLRRKYRSAVYGFRDSDLEAARAAIAA